MLRLRSFASGPPDYNPDLRWARMFGPGHDKCLPIPSDVVSAGSATSVELVVKQLDWLTRPENRLDLYRHTHHFGPAAVKDLPPAPDPARLFSAIS
jgi:hypothetical protein